MPTSIRFARLALLALTMSCATRTAANLSSRDESDLRLISCPPPIASLDNTRPKVSVQLRYTVNTEGRVEPGSVRLVPNLNATAPESAVAAAKAEALGCTYEPPVRPVSVSRWFTVDAPGASVRRQ
jgi:hypothetical protein